ncbi:MAG: translation elongation factor 4, partial [Patescibacteria group bacterium]
NLVDTPGHVDFSYEVSRSLAAVEGAVLLVDATQGIQAQTLSHGLAALEQNLILIPAVNKIDLPNANIEKTKKELVETFGFKEDEILLASGKTGQGVEDILQAVIECVPSPKSRGSNITNFRGCRALIFDSFFDSYKGVVAAVRIMDGEVTKVGSDIKFLGTQADGQVLEMGIFTPQLTSTNSLLAGEIGYIATGIKEPDKVRVGDTITSGQGTGDSGQAQPLPGYKEVKPMVFVGLYPIDQDEFHDIKEALEKFRLNDPAFTYELEHSTALGAGFRCGFLGLLHAEVVQERLSSEFGAELLATAPSVEYMLSENLIHNPSDLPQGENLKDLKEPWVYLKIFVPQTFIGPVMELATDKRGKFINMTHFGTQVEMSYEMPLAEMVTNFYDRLKSVSSGFASLDWKFLDFREVDAVRVDILVAGEKVDALSQIVVREKAEGMGRRLVDKLKEVLPRQNFEVALQATIGGKVIARETISAVRKDVTAKLYGGDRTRKDKLLEKQKKGKKKMKMIGRVEIPQEAFLNILKS